MKRITIAALIAGLSAGPFGAGLAQADREMMEGMHEEMMEGMHAEKHQDGQAPKLKEKLGLSDEQAEKLKTLRKAHHDAVAPLRKQIKDNMEKLRDQVKNKAGDAEIQATLDQLEQTHKSVQEAREKMKTDTASILTSTQRAKMLLGIVRRGHGQWKGRGGRMGDRPEKE